MASAAGNSSSSLRSPCRSFPNFLLSLLNISLVALAAAALGPVLLLRPRPTPFGWALVSVHGATLLSALVSLYVLLARRHLCCCLLPAQAALAVAVAALCAHALALYALFRCHDRSLTLLGSARDRREQLMLVFLEELLLLGMFLVQALALAAACVVGRRWAMEHEAQKAAAARKLMAPVQAEAGVRAVDEKVPMSSEGAGGKKVRWGNAEGC